MGSDKGSHPIRNICIAVQKTPESWKLEDVKRVLQATNPGRVTSAGQTYKEASTAFNAAATSLSAHMSKLRKGWSGDAAEGALKQMSQLKVTASGLGQASSQIGAALETHGTSYLSWYKDKAGNLGHGFIEDSGDDKYAREFLDRMNVRVSETFNGMPLEVSKDIPTGIVDRRTPEFPVGGSTREIGPGPVSPGPSGPGGVGPGPIGPGPIGPGPGEGPGPIGPGPISPGPGGGGPGPVGPIGPGGPPGGGGPGDLIGVPPGAGVGPGPGPGPQIPPGGLGPGPGVPPPGGGVGPGPFIPGVPPGPGGTGGGPIGRGPGGGTGVRPGGSGLRPPGFGGGIAPGGVLGGNRGGIGAGARGVGARGAAGARGAGAHGVGRNGVIGGGRGAGMAPMGGGQGGQDDEELERTTWLTEDEDVWTDDESVPPPVIG